MNFLLTSDPQALESFSTKAHLLFRMSQVFPRSYRILPFSQVAKEVLLKPLQVVAKFEGEY